MKCIFCGKEITEEKKMLQVNIYTVFDGQHINTFAHYDCMNTNVKSSININATDIRLAVK